jgi:glycosyltransferase A (GT-A) superfamily protein (DUF2064 family)
MDVVDRAAPDVRLLVFDGDPAAWRRPGWAVVSQVPGGLDARLAAAFAEVPSGPSLLVGMDTPQLAPAHLGAFDPERYDACLGLARDGGYWSIGFADPRWAGPAIQGVPMSTHQTGAVQLSRLRALGLRVQLLEPLTDVDTIDTAIEVATLAPGTRFAAAMGDPVAAA